MKRSLLLAILIFVAGGFRASSGVADDTLVEFKGGIGVIPVSSAAGTANANGTFPDVNRNAVRGVNPPGQIWAIKDLEATIKSNGEISIEGKGLILAGGDSVGRATGQKVFATLICEAKTPFTERNTDLAGVALAANGDFHIDDILSPAPPVECESPVLLIRNAANKAWFAAGILKTGNSDD